MALHIECDMCGDELDEPGMVIVVPVYAEEFNKYHVCVGCMPDILELMRAAHA